MRVFLFWLIVLHVCCSLHAISQETGKAVQGKDNSRWSLNTEGGITWQVGAEKHLPHIDHLEMSGRKVSGIITYGVDAERNLMLSREIIWPMLQTIPGPDEPDWAKYRAYLRRTYGKEAAPEIKLDGQTYKPGKISKISFNGLLRIEHEPANGLAITRTLFPSPTETAFIEKWEMKNVSNSKLEVLIPGFNKEERETGIYGEYILSTSVKVQPTVSIAPGASLQTVVVFSANKTAEDLAIDPNAEEQARLNFVQQVRNSLVLQTPDPVLNRMFQLSKIRAAESLFETKMRLVHSPGGGRYYGGIWANDQVEYAGPFFPYLGYAPANEAALNTYRKFAAGMKPDYSRMWASYEMECDFPCCSKDRGDAAMYALARGDRIAEELWPAIEWALEYNRRQKTEEGVIASETDEMEDRIPTGEANLSTSSLAYGGLRAAADLARSLDKPLEAEKLDKEADALAASMEAYFGATIKGLETYRYFDGHETLRHWISLPLTMGILSRKEGTMQALFTHLWTPEGLAVELRNEIFWDRGTLYGLRGAFNAGETQMAYQYLKAYTQRRLLGDHVPYAVEAYPEGGQAHLSAESALYGRIITEGMFGIKPTGLTSFNLTPRLPGNWPQMELKIMKAFDATTAVQVKRTGKNLQVTVLKNGKRIFSQKKAAGSTFEVKL